MNNFNKKVSLISIGIMIVSFLSSISGQNPDTIWTKTYGGSSYESCYSLQLTIDGGYILGAETESQGAGMRDIWLIKTDANGDTLWTRTYGGDKNEVCRAVLQTPDGGYFVAGWTESFGPTSLPDVYLIKTDSLGDTLWTRRYGSWNPDLCYSAQLTSDGGYIVAGSTWSYGPGGQSGYLLKLNSYGDTTWTKTYGGIDEDLLWSIQQTPDGGYIICGFTASYGAGGDDAWLIRTDSLGDTLWTRTYGGSSWDYGVCVDQTADGGYIISGRTNSFGVGGSDLWLIKTDANGSLQWQRTYGDTGFDEGRAIYQLANGGYIVAGFQEFPPGFGYADAYLIRTDINGDTIWTRRYGYDGYWDDICSFQPIPDLGYIACGATNAYGAGFSDVWLLKFDADTFDIGEDTKKTIPLYNMVISPNPFRNKTVISFDHGASGKGILTNDRNQPLALKIYDSAGRLVKDYTALLRHPVSNNRISWDGSDHTGYLLPSGVYFMHLDNNDHTILIKKVIKIE